MPEHLKSAWLWKGTAIQADTEIKADRITIPTFISHGTDDQIWSVEKTRKIESLMKVHGLKPDVYYFEGEGHNLTEAASRNRMELLLNFLEQHINLPNE